MMLLSIFFVMFQRPTMRGERRLTLFEFIDMVLQCVLFRQCRDAKPMDILAHRDRSFWSIVSDRRD
ncbi:hypothetical protein [Glaciimonas immobilis]|uniref:Uncharacterized protein n=1 Tax=Glaciimonas immobilis TaxID=728004 RepID=A0A840RXF8_9BURK|nr:hypothetical protein [Glaciimonas immobilis]KAF3998508.1 hypothetical protein HAV38_06510 [Glaciimonas immobilis]MBB5201354.1 hypothetical protein [Glaciimonas immobilis]